MTSKDSILDGKQIIVGLSGGIACYKIEDLVSTIGLVTVSLSAFSTKHRFNFGVVECFSKNHIIGDTVNTCD